MSRSSSFSGDDSPPSTLVSTPSSLSLADYASPTTTLANSLVLDKADAEFERRLALATARIEGAFERRLSDAAARFAADKADLNAARLAAERECYRVKVALAAAEQRCIDVEVAAERRHREQEEVAAAKKRCEAQVAAGQLQLDCLRSSNVMLHHKVQGYEEQAEGLRSTLVEAYEEKDRIKDAADDLKAKLKEVKGEATAMRAALEAALAKEQAEHLNTQRQLLQAQVERDLAQATRTPYSQQPGVPAEAAVWRTRAMQAVEEIGALQRFNGVLLTRCRQVAAANDEFARWAGHQDRAIHALRREVAQLKAHRRSPETRPQPRPQPYVSPVEIVRHGQRQRCRSLLASA
jgi:chromosome segregation ATPase